MSLLGGTVAHIGVFIQVLSCSKQHYSSCCALVLGIIGSGRFDGANRFGMANRKPTGFDLAVVTLSG